MSCRAITRSTYCGRTITDSPKSEGDRLGDLVYPPLYRRFHFRNLPFRKAIFRKFTNFAQFRKAADGGAPSALLRKNRKNECAHMKKTEKIMSRADGARPPKKSCPDQISFPKKASRVAVEQHCNILLDLYPIGSGGGHVPSPD